MRGHQKGVVRCLDAMVSPLGQASRAANPVIAGMQGEADVLVLVALQLPMPIPLDTYPSEE